MGKTFIFRVNLGMWPLKWSSEKNRAMLWGFQHTFMKFPRRIDGKMFIFWVNLGMWPLKSIISEKWACSEGFNTHLWGFQEDRWKMFIFLSKPRHVTPQINCLEKSSPVLRVSTHINGGFKEIDWKTCSFLSKPRHVTPQINHLRNWALFWGFQHTFMGFPRR